MESHPWPAMAGASCKPPRRPRRVASGKYGKTGESDGTMRPAAEWTAGRTAGHPPYSAPAPATPHCAAKASTAASVRASISWLWSSPARCRKAWASRRAMCSGTDWP